jgi:DNA-binding NtrC family response regulator
VVLAVRSAAADAPIGVRHLNLDAAGAGAPAAGAPDVPAGATLREIERRAIRQALRDCKQNGTRAAQQLGIDRSTLRRKIQEFGLEDA